MIGKVGLWCCLLMISAHSFAQSVPQGLTNWEKGRYLKAQEHITRATKVAERVMLLNQNIDSLTQLNERGVMAQCIALQNEVYQRTISAGSLFTTGYGDVFSVLSEAYQRYQKQNPKIVSDVGEAIKDGNARMHEAKVLYRKSRRAASDKEAVDMALQALDYQKHCVNELLYAGNLLVQLAEAAKEERLLARRLVSDSITVVSVPQEFDNAGHRAVLLVTQPRDKNHDVYYSVQFKSLLPMESDQDKRSWYAGKQAIAIDQIDRYYRYSVGRFGSLAEAQSFMAKEQMKGFVIAYRGNERIPVIHASKLLGH